MKRRDFITTSLATSALAGIAPAASALGAPPASGREYYEIRSYHLNADGGHALLDAYLEKALVPALNRAGVRPVGAFTEIEPKDGPSVFVLIPYPSIDAFASAAERVEADADYHKAGAEYLQAPKASPAFARIDSWLLLAFAGLPKMNLPAYSKEHKPRIFELRTYESHGEFKARKKVDMFNAGEIDTMKEVGLAPIFYGQTLVGRDLPHLMYMTSAESQELHKQHWAAFREHPTWKKLQADPQYADTVSKITQRFLVPTAYSQI